jgi:sulfite reductase beta subunit-like hemoprotein
MDIFEKSLETIENLGVKESELESGAIDAAGFKPTGAPQGVYEQRDGLFMFRVRVPAGHLSAADLKAVAKIAKDSGASHVHFTTRQDVQLHGLKPGAFAKTGRALVTAGIPARRGGETPLNSVAVRFSASSAAPSSTSPPSPQPCPTACSESTSSSASRASTRSRFRTRPPTTRARPGTISAS